MIIYHKMVAVRLCLFICALTLFTSCADYENGYQQGYNNIEARKWLVIGRDSYKKGYQEGQMQAFQDDWYAENVGDMTEGLSCPAVFMRSNLALIIRGQRFAVTD